MVDVRRIIKEKNIKVPEIEKNYENLLLAEEKFGPKRRYEKV